MNKKTIKFQIDVCKKNESVENLDLLLSAVWSWVKQNNKHPESIISQLNVLEDDLRENGIVEAERIFNFVKFII